MLIYIVYFQFHFWEELIAFVIALDLRKEISVPHTFFH